jgi:hypothetical protein
MISRDMIQEVQESFPDLYSPNDPDLILLSDYSIFKSGTSKVINDFFEEVETYGSISGMPSDVLFFFQKQFEYFLNCFQDIHGRLSASVNDITLKISRVHDTGRRGSFIEWLYSKKRSRFLEKISYYDYIRDLAGYVHYFLLLKAN